MQRVIDLRSCDGTMWTPVFSLETEGLGDFTQCRYMTTVNLCAHDYQCNFNTFPRAKKSVQEQVQEYPEAEAAGNIVSRCCAHQHPCRRLRRHLKVTAGLTLCPQLTIRTGSSVCLSGWLWITSHQHRHLEPPRQRSDRRALGTARAKDMTSTVYTAS